MMKHRIKGLIGGRRRDHGEGPFTAYQKAAERAGLSYKA